MAFQSAFLPILVLGLMTSLVRCAPFTGRLNGTVERRWETLYSRSLARIPGEKREINRDSDYLMGIKRLRRLYCNVGIGFHIQVSPDGRITGVHSENRYSKFNVIISTFSRIRLPSRVRCICLLCCHSQPDLWPAWSFHALIPFPCEPLVLE